MKSRARSSLAFRRLYGAARVLIALAAILLSGSASAAPTSYTFNVPRRPAPLLPVSRVVVRLEGIDPGYIVKLNNTVVPVPSFGGIPNPGITGSPSDNVKATNVGNVLTLEINADSLVQLAPLKPCLLSGDFTAGSVPYTITLEQPPASPLPTAASSAYRITFYSSMSENISDEGCQTRVRRIPIPAGVWSATPGGTDLGRAPFDTILVIDESGSMLSSTPIVGSPAVSRWALSVQALTEFTQVLATADPDVQDRVALVFYDDTITKITSGGPAPSGAVRWFPKTEFPLAQAIIQSNTHPRAGMTSIGGGLQAALTDAVASAGTGRDATIVLMSDGLQNTSPCIVPDPASLLTLSAGSPCPGAAPGTSLVSNHIPILGITVGLIPATAGALDLQGITNQTAKTDSAYALLAGTAWDPAAQAYGNMLVQQLKGNTLQVLEQTSDTVAVGAPASAPTKALVDGTVKRVVATLSWLPVQQNANSLVLQVKRPGGDWTAVGGDFGVGTHVSVGRQRYPYLSTAGFDVPAAAIGDWEFRALRLSSQAGAVPYHLRVYAVERSLDFRLQLLPGRHATGEPLILDAEVLLDGKPVVGIGGGLGLSVEGPQGAIGTLLRNAKDPGGTGTSEPTATPFEKKVSNLLQDPTFAPQVAAMTKSSPLTLTERGNGVYRFQLNDTQLSGGYKFRFTLDLNGPSGRLRRIEDLMTQVEALPDPKTTTIAVSAGTVAGSYNVIVTPLDRFGNYVGPGFDGRVKLTLPAGQGKVASVTDPRVDGTYLIQLTDVPAGADPLVSLEINEVRVASAPLSKLPTAVCKSSRGCACGGAGGGGQTCLPLAGLALLGMKGRRRHRGR